MGNHQFCLNKGEELVAKVAEKTHISQEHRLLVKMPGHENV